MPVSVPNYAEFDSNLIELRGQLEDQEARVDLLADRVAVLEDTYLAVPDDPDPDPEPAPVGELGGHVLVGRMTPPWLVRPTIPVPYANEISVVAPTGLLRVARDSTLVSLNGQHVERLELPEGRRMVMVIGPGSIGEARLTPEGSRGAPVEDVVFLGVKFVSPASPYVHSIMYRANRLAIIGCEIHSPRYCLFGGRSEDVWLEDNWITSHSVDGIADEAAVRLYDHTRTFMARNRIDDSDKHSFRVHGDWDVARIEDLHTVGGGVMIGYGGDGVTPQIRRLNFYRAAVDHTIGNGGWLVKPEDGVAEWLATGSVITHWSAPSGFQEVGSIVVGTHVSAPIPLTSSPA